MRRPHPFRRWPHGPAALVLLAAGCGAPPGPPAHVPESGAPASEAAAALRHEATTIAGPKPWKEQPCPPGVASRERAIIRFAKGEARILQSTFSPPGEDAPLPVVWQQDLNGDGRLDLAVSHLACGNHGECSYAVYAQCEGGVYAPVFEPEYLAIPPTPGARRDNGWRRLETATRSQDPTTLIESATSVDLVFEDGRYIPL